MGELNIKKIHSDQSEHLQSDFEVSSIPLRSEAVQDILGRPPQWMIRWGISMIFVIVLGLFVGSYFFKYPDIVQATVTVNSEQPALIFSKTCFVQKFYLSSHCPFERKWESSNKSKKHLQFSSLARLKGAYKKSLPCSAIKCKTKYQTIQF